MLMVPPVRHTETKLWKRVDTTRGTVSHFARHTAEVVGNCIVLYGGYDGVSRFFELAVFDTGTRLM